MIVIVKGSGYAYTVMVDTHERVMPLTVILLHRPPGEQSSVATVEPEPVPEILN